MRVARKIITPTGKLAKLWTTQSKQKGTERVRKREARPVAKVTLPPKKLRAKNPGSTKS